jgi:hypothetical protein
MEILMKCIMLGILALVCLTTAVFAKNDIPTICPDVNTIKAVGIESLEYSRFVHVWSAATHSDYGTNQQWTLHMEVYYQFSDDDGARKVAISQLNQLQFNNGPIKLENENLYICLYGIFGPNRPYASLSTAG